MKQFLNSLCYSKLMRHEVKSQNLARGLLISIQLNSPAKGI